MRKIILTILFLFMISAVCYAQIRYTVEDVFELNGTIRVAAKVYWNDVQEPGNADGNTLMVFNPVDWASWDLTTKEQKILERINSKAKSLLVSKHRVATGKHPVHDTKSNAAAQIINPVHVLALKNIDVTITQVPFYEDTDFNGMYDKELIFNADLIKVEKDVSPEIPMP